MAKVAAKITIAGVGELFDERANFLEASPAVGADNQRLGMRDSIPECARRLPG